MLTVKWANIPTDQNLGQESQIQIVKLVKFIQRICINLLAFISTEVV